MALLNMSTALILCDLNNIHRQFCRLHTNNSSR
jgi:hypothetical protein